MQVRSIRNFTLFGAALLSGSLSAAPALACGGLFCSQAASVNQSAERIIFSNDGNGTVTAVIQIMYEGPSESFSWLLPIPAVPDDEGEIAVASDLAFTRLQAATNPQYNLNTRVEGTCRQDPREFDADVPAQSGSSFLSPSADSVANESAGVTVAASGVVGNFDWTALELDPALDDPAGAAITWLTENGYDVLPNTAQLIGPYLENGLYLLALKLTKGSPVGAIRPIVLTYPGELPSIPIKLTAVAANDDMGVMTWMLSGARAVPFNYADLELNEARIDWFTSASNYDAVVTAAADDAGGQGFVTEFAGDSQSLGRVVWPSFEEDQWNALRGQAYAGFGDIFTATWSAYGSYDGFWEVARANVRLPAGITLEDLQACPAYCYDVQLTPTTYFEALETGVIEPLRLVQRLIDRQPYVTRLYSTLSAADMTTDPVFTYNPSLSGVSNVHTADRIIECNPNIYEWQANWRIVLPQGGVLRGTPDDVGVWPSAVADQPANARIRTLSESGPGRVMQDNSDLIIDMLDAYNEQVPLPTRLPDPQMGSPSGASTGTRPDRNTPAATNPGMSSGRPLAGSSGCALGAGASPVAPAALGWGCAAFAAVVLARRRRR